MEIQELNNAEVYEALHGIWDQGAEFRSDSLRDPDILDYFLFQDGGATRFFLIGNTPSVALFSNIEEGLNALVTLLNPEEADAGQILSELTEVMGIWSLKRLTAHVPGPVKKVQSTLKEVGFRREGHLRRATYWNGRLCGIDIYGLYKDAPRRKQSRKEESAKLETVA